MTTGSASETDSAAVARGVGIVVRDVRREFPGPIVALDGVSLTVEPGAFVLLNGHSGSGKTTLLAIIGGLDRPSSGAVELDGRPTTEWRSDALRREVIGFVFQHHYLLSHLSAHANVEVPLIGAGVPARERHRRAHELLDEVGLSHRRDSLARHLSGGERQRVAIARALVNNPRLMLADEPTESLDGADAERVLDLLEEARTRRDMTQLVVSHDEAVGRRAERRLELRDGRLAAAEPPYPESVLGAGSPT